MPRHENFEIVEVQVPDPADGQVLIQNLWMSVDPYMRGRMTDRESYIEPFKVGQVMSGGAVGEVKQSKNPAFEPGDLVLHMGGWREFLVSDGRELQKLPATGAPAELYLGLLGIPGLTAYFGLFEIGELKEGETVFVSAAAGAVGSVVCQIARMRNCRVIGTAGSDRKVEYLRKELGVDEAINYSTAEDLSAAVRAAAGDGIDLYFDNVGAEHLEAALDNMKPFGRIVACGMIHDYNLREGAGVRNLIQVVGKRLRMQGFIVPDFTHRFEPAVKELMGWYHEGLLNAKETVYEGIEKAPDAFIGMLKGENTGKMLVNLCEHEYGIEVL